MKGQTALTKYERIYKSPAETITEDNRTYFQIKAPCPQGCFLPDFFYSPTMNWLILSPSKIPLPPTALYLGGIRRSMPYWNRCLRSWRKTGIHRRMISRTNRRITGQISEEEYSVLSEEEQENRSRTDIVGKSGIEKAFDDILRGTNGETTFYVDMILSGSCFADSIRMGRSKRQSRRSDVNSYPSMPGIMMSRSRR